MSLNFTPEEIRESIRDDHFRRMVQMASHINSDLGSGCGSKMLSEETTTEIWLRGKVNIGD